MRGFEVLAPRLGDHYLIYGAGTMGPMMMELAKRAGAASVSMVDLNPARLETAKEPGCTHTVTSADELEQQRGWDNVVDCTGVVAVIEDGLGRVIRGGTFQQFGVASEDAVARFSPFRVYNQEILNRPVDGGAAQLRACRGALRRRGAAAGDHDQRPEAAGGVPGDAGAVPRGGRAQDPGLPMAVQSK